MRKNLSNIEEVKEKDKKNEDRKNFYPHFQIVDKKTKISMNVLMFWSFFKKNKPYG